MFSDAYEEYKDAIFRHCYFHTFDREQAKDAMQETFIKTWQYLESGHKIDNLRAFLYKVATNLIINAARKKKSVSLEGLMVPWVRDWYCTGRQLSEKSLACTAESLGSCSVVRLPPVSGAVPVSASQTPKSYMPVEPPVGGQQDLASM